MYRLINNKTLGFTLAELLIALAILGVIATFTIPKVLQGSRNDQWDSSAKEAISMISGAFSAYQLNNAVSASTTIGDLTPYMNYVRVDTSSAIDLVYGNAGSTTCASTGGAMCLKLHSGALLRLSTVSCFFGTTNLNALSFHYDPDGIFTDTTATGSGKALSIRLYPNGRITTRDSVLAGTLRGNGNCTGTVAESADPSLKPDWFDW